jgi:hypothetical protein
MTRAVPAVLSEVRAAYDGPIIMMKGPVVAARFPVPSRRPFLDLDLLVPDPSRAYAVLVAAGFMPSGDPATYENVPHHLGPLRSPTKPLLVELHSRPKWVERLDPPDVETLVREAVPADLGAEGILTLAPEHHVLVLAAHVWAHDPLTKLLRIIDVAVMAAGLDRDDVDALARAWGVGRLWRSTTAVADALFHGRPEPFMLRVAGRGLKTARESTVLELHAGRLIAPFCIHSSARAFAAASSLGGFLRRHDGESWGKKLVRTAAQLSRPSMPRSEHLRRIASVGGHDHADETSILAQRRVEKDVSGNTDPSPGIANPPKGV